jgi:8-oxo-dGTP pyrophosphatase MutT (NUDIX family)
VLREGAGSEGPELFMVRRSAKSQFMPQTLVFPGGRVDAEDGEAGSDAAYEAAARRECLEEAAIALTDHPLTWFDTWLTPSVERRRYLARFFLAHVEHGEVADARPDGHETTEGAWDTPAGFLARWERSEVDLPPPTLSILIRLSRGNLGALDRRDKAELLMPILPKVHPAGSELRIVMPHHPEYPGAPGEGADAPARVHELPLGFTREEKRWRPWLD